jgi:acyl carrier protein
MEESSINKHNDLSVRRVIAVVQRLIKPGSLIRPISNDDKLIEIGLTSLDLARLVLLVEDEFNLTFPACDLTPANFRTISTISRLVTKSAGASNVGK